MDIDDRLSEHRIQLRLGRSIGGRHRGEAEMARIIIGKRFGLGEPWLTSRSRIPYERDELAVGADRPAIADKERLAHLEHLQLSSIQRQLIRRRSDEVVMI